MSLLNDGHLFCVIRPVLPEPPFSLMQLSLLPWKSEKVMCRFLIFRKNGEHLKSHLYCFIIHHNKMTLADFIFNETGGFKSVKLFLKHIFIICINV